MSALVAAGNEGTNACTKSPARCLLKHQGSSRVYGRAGAVLVLSAAGSTTPLRAQSGRPGARLMVVM